MKYLGYDHGKKSGLSILNTNEFELAWTHTLEGTNKDECFYEMYNYANKMILRHKPDILCVERTDSMINAETARRLIGYNTILHLLAKKHNLPICEVGVMTARKHVCGNGRAEKSEVAEKLCELLGISLDEIVDYEHYLVGKKKGQVKKIHYDKSDSLLLCVYAARQRGEM